jgi:hypothetical protein
MQSEISFSLQASPSSLHQAVEILAKQLVKVRSHKAQSLQASGHIQGLATQNTMMASNIRMANAMEVTESAFHATVE